jgi:glycine/D-amino acid oxidase-like deaminating enzyme
MFNRIADVLIVGAGMAGVAAAYQLAVRSGLSRITLIDSREPLSLTSNKGTEAYRNYWPGPDGTMVRFMNRSIDLLDALDSESGGAFELNRRGYAFLTANPDEAAKLRGHAGPTAQFIEDPRAIRARYPFVTERVVAMLHVHRAGYMNATKLGVWLLAHAQSLGVSLVRDDAIGVVVENQRFVGVRLASGARIDAGALILAAGPRLPEWSAQLEITVPVVNELHGKISFEDDTGVLPRDLPLMIWNDPVNLGAFGTLPAGVHLRPRGARSLLGIWTYDTRIEEPAFPPTFEPEYPEVVIRGLSAMVPGLQAYVARARGAIVDGGYYCKAPDNRPLIGPTPIAGTYLLGALSGFGIMASQAAAELAAAHLLEGPLPDYAAAFHPARFDDPAYQQKLATLDPKAGQL